MSNMQTVYHLIQPAAATDQVHILARNNLLWRRPPDHILLVVTMDTLLQMGSSLILMMSMKSTHHQVFPRPGAVRH